MCVSYGFYVCSSWVLCGSNWGSDCSRFRFNFVVFWGGLLCGFYLAFYGLDLGFIWFLCCFLFGFEFGFYVVFYVCLIRVLFGFCFGFLLATSWLLVGF